MTTETSIYEYARRGLEISKGKTAIWFCGKDISFLELFSRIDNMAELLSEFGVHQGSVVTIHLPNSPQTVISFYAVAKLGGICNMVHAQTPVHGVRDLMTFSDSSFLITYVPECTKISNKTILVDVFCSGEFQSLHWPPLSLDRPIEETCCNNANFPLQDSLAQRCAVYLHSSGSTGSPKTIMLSHSALNNCAENTSDMFEDNDMADHVALGVLPLFHGFGLVMDVHRNISFGSKLVQMLRWNTKEAIQLIKEHQVTALVGVPAMYHALLGDPDFSGKGIAQLLRCCIGGDNVTQELVEQFDARIGAKRRTLVGYGLTEATTTNLVNSSLHYKLGSCGYPMRNTLIAIIDDTGNITDFGTGELIISSKTLMMGYLKDPEGTKQAFIFRDGKKWVRTGDRVKIDADGFVFFFDRLKNVINHKGYNIYPAQVEASIKCTPGVQDVCVLGVLNESLHTQDIRALVILEPGKDPACMESLIKQVCQKTLPLYSIPKEIRFVSAFPQNKAGKRDRLKMSQPNF